MGKDEPKWEKNAHEGHVEKETNVRDGHVPHFLLLSFFFYFFIFFYHVLPTRRTETAVY